MPCLARSLVRTSVASRYAGPLLEELLRWPAMSANNAATRLGVSYQTANQLLSGFLKLGLLEEVTGGRRNRVFPYQPYIDSLGGRFEP